MIFSGVVSSDRPNPTHIKTYADFFPSSWLKIRVHWDTTKDIQSHILLSHGDPYVFRIVFRGDQASSLDVKSRFFVDFADGTIQIRFFFVDFAPRKAPLGAFPPSLHQHGLVHGLIQKNGTADRNAGLVCYKLFIGLYPMLLRKLGKERTMLENEEAEAPEVHGRQARVKRADEILVEPLCFFDLEAYAFY